jgi:hypothetical protein
LPLSEERYTRLLGYENVDDVPFANGMLAVSITIVTDVVPIQAIGKRVPMLVYGFVERAIHTDLYIAKETTPS